MTSTEQRRSEGLDDEATDELAARLRTAVTVLNRRLRQQSLGGISPAQASLLATVSRLGSATLGELARAELIQPPSMTKLVSALEQQGLVERSADERDRRVARVVITESGRAEVERIRRAKTSYLVAQLDALSDPELAEVSELVGLLERLGGLS